MAGLFRAAIDGGSRGNPGLAAWGVAVLDAEANLVEGHSGFLGHATNNVAEYQALLEALRLAEARGADRVEIRADSELLVRQIEGRYRVKTPHLKPLHAEALRRIGRFASCSVVHVRRAENKHADRLVNLELDRRDDASIRPQPEQGEASEPRGA